MSSYIDCVVDTAPMAKEIDSVSGHIKGTTTAVVAMQTAVVAAEKDAADHICSNVNRGFYSLIHSQISQKIALLHSQVDSHLMKLNQLSKQLKGIQSRMERDYRMISARYAKLFNGLNKNLYQRVYELDKPTIDFSQKEVNTISNRTVHLTATIPVSQLESLVTSQKILASNIKFRGNKVIESMTNFLTDMNKQKIITGQILLSSKLDDNHQEAQIMTPIIISEMIYDKSNTTQTQITLNKDQLGQHTCQNIINNINNITSEITWEDNSEVKSEISSEFLRLNHESSASERVKGMTMKLFKAGSIQTIKR